MRPLPAGVGADPETDIRASACRRRGPPWGQRRLISGTPGLPGWCPLARCHPLKNLRNTSLRVFSGGGQSRHKASLSDTKVLRRCSQPEVTGAKQQPGSPALPTRSHGGRTAAGGISWELPTRPGVDDKTGPVSTGTSLREACVTSRLSFPISKLFLHHSPEAAHILQETKGTKSTFSL